jgi:diaminopimelate epimerase
MHAELASAGEMTIETGAGALKLEALARKAQTFRFRADMGPPRDIETGVSIDGVRATILSMGNPHCVVFTDVDALDEIGPRLECHPRFPERTNVEIVEIVDRHTLRMAIWERGAGETASSGTGSSASAVAAIANRRAETPVAVNCPGGTLEVEWTEGGNVFLTGDATVIAEGRYWRGS